MKNLFKIFRSKHTHELVVSPVEDLNAPKLSYSQAGEDLIIDFIFKAIGRTNIHYVDIGAHEPIYLSNTYLFYEKGNRGVLIDASIECCRRSAIARPEDIIQNIGVTGKDASVLDFYIMDPPTLNTFSKEEASLCGHEIKEILRIKVENINTILGNLPFKQIDLLSLDVEGLDEEIIHSMNFEKFRPTVICLETITYSKNRDGKKKVELINTVVANDYVLFADTYINTIFVDRKSWISSPAMETVKEDPHDNRNYCDN